jgi:tetratricopeptide (TPR) repeat protein
MRGRAFAVRKTGTSGASGIVGPAWWGTMRGNLFALLLTQILNAPDTSEPRAALRISSTSSGAFSRLLLASWLASAIVVGVLSASPEARGQESQLDSLAANVRAHPGDADAALALGRALRRAGRTQEALAELRAAIGRLPGSPATGALVHELSRVYADAHDFNAAMGMCEKFRKNPGVPMPLEGHVCAAEAQFVRQRASEALVETAAALAIDPRSFDAKVAEGRAHELELDLGKAESSLREALAIREGDAGVHLALGRVLAKAGRRAEGVAELRKALALDPDSPEGLYELANGLGSDPESVGFLQHATRERPKFADAWLALAGRELAAGHLTEAAKAAKAASDIDPKDAHARLILAQLAFAEGRFDDALSMGNAVVKAMPNNAAAQLLVADTNAKRGDIDVALEQYQSAWGLDHANPAPLVNASVASHLQGRDTTARAFGARATQEFPSWGPGWVALGDALVAQREPGLAKDAYGKALAATGGSIDRADVQRRLAAIDKAGR